jgi:hypothetical protein
MDARLAARIETNVERGASALFAGAVGYAAYALLGDLVSLPELAACGAAAAIIANLLSARSLAAAARRTPKFKVPVFNVGEIGIDDELILTEADRLPPEELVLGEADRADSNELVLTERDRLGTASEPLILDDILAELGPDSRVVRLFDRKAMPTAGQLKRRIDTHLEGGAAPVPAPDASQALSDALAELRRSLR